MPRSQVKDHKITKLPKQRGSRQKPSITSAASSSKSRAASSGMSPSALSSWSKEDLVKKARQLGISGRSTMNKSQLVSALRKH